MAKQNRTLTFFAAIILWTVLSAAGELMAEDVEDPAGKALFMEHKCYQCHAVPAAGIEAKTKSSKMKGADLGGPIEAKLDVVAAYLRKQTELDGRSHKKEYKGTDEELQAIFNWLAELEPESGDSPG